MQTPVKSDIACPACFSDIATLLPLEPPTPCSSCSQLCLIPSISSFCIHAKPLYLQFPLSRALCPRVCLAVLFPLCSSNITSRGRIFPDHIIKRPVHSLSLSCAILSTACITTGVYLMYLVFGLLSASPTPVERDFVFSLL